MGVSICRGRSESMGTQTFLLYSVWRLEYIWKICILSALWSVYEEKKMARGIIDRIIKQIAWNQRFRNLAIDELQKATRKIEAAPKADEPQGWIPCSERTPEEDGEYLITLDFEWGREIEIGLYADGEWLNDNRHANIAWRPLIEPWKGEE